MTYRKKTKSKRKKLGRPRKNGPGVAVMIRMHAPQLDAIDDWIGESGLSRPEAIRQLVDHALERTPD